MPASRTHPQRNSFAREMTRIGRGGARIMKRRRLGQALDLPTGKAAMRELLADAIKGKAITKCQT